MTMTLLSSPEKKLPKLSRNRASDLEGGARQRRTKSEGKDGGERQRRWGESGWKRWKILVEGYDWQSGKLDPSMMNRKEENLLPHLVQVSINLDANGECQECSVKSLNEWKKASDFPVINQDYSGAKNTYIYAATTSGSRQALPHFPFDTVLKLNTLNKSIHTWSVGSRRFIGEPIFVPKGTQEEEDNGYILVVEYAVSTQRCYLVVLSSKKIGETGALVARLEVPRSLNFPLGFHGFWAPSSTSVFHI
ncbi:hypothetical protein TEA_024500 [Camellia sinensis var. sinensis]|uniref:Uncharacterized protein n=1 Tax=Camellia sinensis var. sinensis TaxID=542762 RepID=A0A4S4D0X2_CAMSN|nr:hypothetical protein TEA_024500 [Camellia sinensis var. sinensis]